MARIPYRDRPKRIAVPCDGCGVLIIGTSIRAFDEARAEHYAQAHGIPRATGRGPAESGRGDRAGD